MNIFYYQGDLADIHVFISDVLPKCGIKAYKHLLMNCMRFTRSRPECVRITGYEIARNSHLTRETLAQKIYSHTVVRFQWISVCMCPV